MTANKKKRGKKKAKRKWPLAICPRCWAEPDEEVDPIGEGHLVEIPEDLHEPDQPPYTHECQVCGLQVYLEAVGPKRVAKDKAGLFAAMDIPDESYFEGAISDWTDGDVMYDKDMPFEDGVILYGGGHGIQLEYPLDIREFWSYCQILAYMDLADWKWDSHSPSKLELRRTIARLTKEIAELKEELEPPTAGKPSYLSPAKRAARELRTGPSTHPQGDPTESEPPG